MASRIKEKDLILPALKVINEKPGISTSDLIAELEDIFKPDGEDAMILENRGDTKFSQKVRNLRSHRNTNGMSRWTVYGDGSFTITDMGRSHLVEYADELEYILDNLMEYEAAQSKNKELMYREEDLLQECRINGDIESTGLRSKRLKEESINRFKDETGTVICCVCGFDFKEAYGDLGDMFIELHYEKEIKDFPPKGVKLSEAVEMLRPVCANCHRILHKTRKGSMSVAELKGIIAKGGR